jgi:tRNA pseudouridine38-40 synthase
VQDVVEKALRKLNWQGKSVQAAGRTDTGVHAEGQVIAFDLEWNHPAEELRQALNANLPMDVAVRSVKPVPASFHARRDASSRTYHYHIFFEDVRDPLRERYAWRVWPEADPQILQQAAQELVGKHDFTAFGTPPGPGSGTMRKVFQAGWLPEKSAQGDGWIFVVRAEAFLYHMVRRMVSLQVEIAQGKACVEKLLHYLQPESWKEAEGPVYVQGLAPPNGLVLTEVSYPEAKLFLAQPGEGCERFID